MADDENGRDELLEEIEHLKDRLASFQESEEELKHTEQALHESEGRYRRLADATFEGIVLHDNGTIVDVNKTVEDLAGYTREELIGTNMLSILEPESLELVRERVQIDDESPYEIYARAKDGSRLELEVQGKVIPYRGSTVRVAAVRDIRERKAAEEAMDWSESRYRLLAENVEDIIFTIGNDLTFNYVSPSFECLTGYSVDELMEMGWEGLFAPETLEAIMESISEDVFGIMDDGKEPTQESVMVEAELRKKDGNSCWVEVNVSTIHDPEGNIREMLGVARDITDRREAAVALTESEERYRLLAENVADIIFVMGIDLTFDYVSPSFEKVTGYTVEKLKEMGWQDMLTPDSLEVALSIVAEKMIESMEDRTAPQESVILEMEILTKEGNTVWTEVNLSILRDPDGETRGILGVARDVSERMATQERFIEEKKRAELYLDLFGHDIRNINQGILSYLELMMMRPGIEPEEADYIKSVMEQAIRINDLVAKVQRLTQLRARRIPIEDVDAQPFIHAAIDYINAKYSDRDLRIETRSACSLHVVRGSKMLTDVFTSILDNAVRFNRNETVEVDISCKTSEDGGSIHFIFEDRGPGISDETKDKVFRRLEQPEGGLKGSGLGLTVVWEIIRQLGGRVWVEDRVYGDPTKGSRFVVELPKGSE